MNTLPNTELKYKLFSEPKIFIAEAIKKTSELSNVTNLVSLAKTDGNVSGILRARVPGRPHSKASLPKARKYTGCQSNALIAQW